MSTVLISPGLMEGEAEVRFKYDPKLVATLKDEVAWDERQWVKEEKCWIVTDWALAAFIAKAEALGWTIVDQRPEPEPEPEPPPRTKAEPPPRKNDLWAVDLFIAVGAQRKEAIFKALTRVLHPDNQSTGDTKLMQSLNRARDGAR